MTHPTDLELDAYAEAGGGGAVEEHIAECTLCGAYVEDARQLLQFARDPEVRTQAEAMRALGRPPRIDEALARKAEIEADNLQAAKRLAPLLKSRSRFIDAEISTDPEFHTPGMVRMLCAEANARVTSRRSSVWRLPPRRTRSRIACRSPTKRRTFCSGWRCASRPMPRAISCR